MKRELEGRERAAGSALCTNRGGVRVSLSLAGALPTPPASARPPPALLFTARVSPSSLSLLLSLPVFSLLPSSFSSLCCKREGDNCSHTLAPSTCHHL
uniref:Macaca fascicularis brain cDNA clone: QtrA-18575, similar to human EGF-like repeats and discoidin I-like domains 3(EDIL3), mRNA, RefSeq: NM_005711.3 n=1 Tax=Macaca fascicularis TaxID=9541 RepID=I7GJI0_MACFA|nr:unnamed protein product [Macaca fascicularis]